MAQFKEKDEVKIVRGHHEDVRRLIGKIGRIKRVICDIEPYEIYDVVVEGKKIELWMDEIVRLDR